MPNFIMSFLLLSLRFGDVSFYSLLSVQSVRISRDSWFRHLAGSENISKAFRGSI